MISPSAAPSDEERRWLEARREIVLDALQPGDRTAIEDKLHGFAFGFSQLRNLDQDTFRGALANFVDAVDHLPFEAVSRACRAWNKAQFKWANTAFPPQAPELARAATEMFCDMRMEERELRILLAAEVGTPEPVRPRIAPQVRKPETGEDLLAAVIKSFAPPKHDAHDPKPAPRSYPPGYLEELEARKARRLAAEAARIQSLKDNPGAEEASA
jgi:hypothetical protein